MIVEKLNEKRINALKCGDRASEKVYSYFLAIAQKVLKDGGDEKKILTSFKKEKKAIQETMQFFTPESDKMAQAQFELSVLDLFLPKQLTQEQISELIQQVANELVISVPSDKGKFMKAVMAKVRGQADGKQVNSLATAYFNQMMNKE